MNEIDTKSLMVNLENIDYELSNINDELFRIGNALEIIALGQMINSTKFDWSINDKIIDPDDYAAIYKTIRDFYCSIAVTQKRRMREEEEE